MVVVVDHEIRTTAGTAREDHPCHRHALQHGLHKDLVIVSSIIAERVNHLVDCLCYGCAAEDIGDGIVFARLGVRWAPSSPWALLRTITRPELQGAAAI